MIPPSLIARYRCYGGDNNAADRNVLKDLSGCGNNITLNGFAWTEQSGYNKSDYKGALVFDGVDDYGRCDTFPVLNKEDGFTIIALRRWIGDYSPKKAFLANCEMWSSTPDGAFNMEVNGGRCVVFGTGLSVANGTTFPNNFCVYMTDETYNGEKALTAGTQPATSTLTLGGIMSDGYPTWFPNIALYALEVYSRRLSEDEINRVKDRLMEEYIRETNCLDGLEYVAEWQTYGKANTDEDRDVIKDLSGNGHDIQLYNLDYTEQSGYNTADYKGALVFDGVDDYGCSNDINDEVGTMICRAVLLTESGNSDYLIESTNYTVTSSDGRLYWMRNVDGKYYGIGLGNELKNSATPPYGCLSREPQDMTDLAIKIALGNAFYISMVFYHLILIRQKCTVEQVECLKWLMDKKYRDYLKNN